VNKLPGTLEIRNHHLHIGGVDIVDVAERFATPFYIYDFERIRENYRALREKLPANLDVCFALKANPSLAIASLLRSLGAGVEIVSEGELAVALEAGFAPENIVLNGPGKTEELLEAAIGHGVGLFNIESVTDFKRLDDIARARKVKVNACVRINPSTDTPVARIRTGGGPQKFGIDESAAGTLIETVLASPMVQLRGIHVFSGSQVLDHHQAISGMAHTIETANLLAQKFRFALTTVNLGGGLGVRYCGDDTDFDLPAFCAGLHDLLAATENRSTRFILEPGRIIVADSGIYVAGVLDVKESQGKRYIITDGGINHALLPVTANEYPVRLLNRADEHANVASFIGGPLCTSVDLRATETLLPDTRPGDLLGILQSGAYGYSASMLHFLSFPTPAEIAVDGGKVSLIRERGDPEDFLRGQKGLPLP